MSCRDIDECLSSVMDHTKEYVQVQGGALHPNTLDALEELKQHQNEGEHA